MKIAFVLDDGLDSTDGVQQYILTLGSWYAKRGHEVHYLVGHTTRTDIPRVHVLSRNVRVRFNGNRMSMPLPASKRAIRQLLEAEKFDVIHVQMPYSPFLAHRVIRAASPGTVVIGTFHIAPHARLVTVATWLLARWTRRSLRRFNSVVSVSTAAQAFARKTYGIETQVVPNCIAIEHFQTTAPKRSKNETFKIVFLGRLVPRKGCQILLQAIVMLRDQIGSLPALEVVIGGKGPLLPELQSFVDTHGLSSVVRFHGFVAEDEKPAFLASADIAVFPSSGGESFGIVLIEAMAAGHAVVLGADNDGYHAVLGPHTASLFPVNDAAALAMSIEQYMSDSELRQTTVRWQELYVRQYDVATVGGRLINIYRSGQRSLVAESKT